MRPQARAILVLDAIARRLGYIPTRRLTPEGADRLLADMEAQARPPHCDQRILHAPGECRYCDEHPIEQDARQTWGIAFTGHGAPPGGLPCPADFARGHAHQEWGGNLAASGQTIAPGHPSSGAS